MVILFFSDPAVFATTQFRPMSNIESLWKDYNTYEQSISVLVAKKMIDDKNKEFINARRATKELEIFQRTLLKNNPAVPPLGTTDERKQLEAWRKYIGRFCTLHA